MTIFETIIGEMPGFVENPRTCRTEYLRAPGFCELDWSKLHDIVRERLGIDPEDVTVLEEEWSFRKAGARKGYLYAMGLKDPCGFVLLTPHEVRTL